MREELKQRLLKHISFLEKEIQDYREFKTTQQRGLLQYNKRDKTRNVERWVENIINSSIDIAKIILTLEGILLPDNYNIIKRLWLHFQ